MLSHETKHKKHKEIEVCVGKLIKRLKIFTFIDHFAEKYSWVFFNSISFF